jgi:hypothetical protein
MEKIDRLGWAAGISFSAFGRRIGIRVTEPWLLDRLDPCLPPGPTPSPRPIVERLYSLVGGGPGKTRGTWRYHVLYAGADRIARERELEGALEALRVDLRLYLAERARQRVFVHAGVVGFEDRAIVLPARSLAGKSELVAALVQAGATYFSDECAVFDREGRVHPYPTPLSLRRDGREVRVPAADLGGSGTAPLRVGMVAAAEYRQGGRWRPRLLSPGQAVLALMANAFSAQRKPAEALDTLRRAVRGAIALRGERGEAEPTARELLGRLQGRREETA